MHGACAERNESSRSLRDHVQSPRQRCARTKSQGFCGAAGAAGRGERESNSAPGGARMPPAAAATAVSAPPALKALLRRLRRLLQRRRRRREVVELPPPPSSRTATKVGGASKRVIKRAQGSSGPVGLAGVSWLSGRTKKIQWPTTDESSIMDFLTFSMSGVF